MGRFLAGLVLGVAVMSVAGSGLASTPITQCETISVSGSYQITPRGQLHSSGGDCLVVTAPNVQISAQTVTIRGSGSGAGVHVTSTAKNFQGSFDFQTSIAGFTVGIELDSAGANVGGNYDEPLQINDVNTAIFISNGSYNSIGFIQTGASYAGAAPTYNGVWILGGGHNHVEGSLFVSSSSSYNCGWAYISSQSDAVRVDNSITNLVDHYCMSGSQVGVHLVNSATYNAVVTNLVTGSAVGISVKNNAGGNFIADNWLRIPGSSSSNGLDLQDNNTNCDNDTWFNNTFGTANPTNCIH